MRAELESWLHGQWSKKGVLALALSPLSLIYLAAVKNRARRIHPEKLPVPVIVVGNIYVGGTGKTPVTIELVKALTALGYHPGVISRGYGRKDSAPVMVVPESPAAVVGDEPLLIVQATGVPAAVARNRTAAGRMLLSAHPKSTFSSATTGCSTCSWRVTLNSRSSAPAASATAGYCPPAPCVNRRRA